MKRPPSTCRKCGGFMERRVPIMEHHGARHFGDHFPFLRMGNLEIHRYVCFKCGHCETFHFDPKAMFKRAPQFKKNEQK